MISKDSGKLFRSFSFNRQNGFPVSIKLQITQVLLIVTFAGYHDNLAVDQTNTLQEDITMTNIAIMEPDQLENVTGGDNLALASADTSFISRPVERVKPAVRPGPSASFGEKIIVKNLIIIGSTESSSKAQEWPWL